MNTSGMGYKILDERYALLECLAVSGIGEIYRGRDLELAQTEAKPSRILIHLLPQNYQISDLKAKLADTQQRIERLNQTWILPILAQGQTEGRQYLILRSPESLGAHSVMSLPSQQLPTLSQLMAQFGYLVKTKQLPSIIDSALLISLPNQSLYLLATAFLPPIHSLRAYHTGLTLYKHPSIKRSLALSSIMAITLSTFAVEYQNKPDTLSLPIIQTAAPQFASAQTVFKTLTPVAPTDYLTLHDRPLASHSLNPALPFALQEPLAAEPAFVALSSNSIHISAHQLSQQTQLAALPSAQLGLTQIEIAVEKATEKIADKTAEKMSEKTTDKITDKKKSTTPPKLEKQQATANTLSKAQAAKPKLAETLVETAVTAQPTTAPAQTHSEALYYTANIEASEAVAYSTPQVAPPTVATPKPVAATTKAPRLSLNDLIERANQALDLENFSEKNGVVFYLRQIKLHDHLHPQIERLGRFVVLYQHEIARNKLKIKATIQAQALLSLSKSLIQEFNLKSLNSAQQVLEHKSNQYLLAH